MHKNKAGYFLILLISFLSFASQSVYAQGTMKIISYNVLDGMSKDTTFDKSEFATWMESQNPDIVGFQELNDFTQEKLEALAAKYNHPYAILMNRHTYKVGITSKYPIVNVQIVTENMSHGFILAQINGYHVVVAHLNPHNYMIRRKEIKIILSTIEASRQNPKEKWILMGDLNSFSPLDKSFFDVDDTRRQKDINSEKIHPYVHNLINGVSIDYEVQQAILTDEFIDTYYAIKENKPKGRIDFIYVSKSLKNNIESSQFIYDNFTKTHSDHHPMSLLLKD